ncbi:MAG: ABC transporter ATP-binding protein [Planctomycetes bacterium]|jgi:ABC-2 type transport system ATP-binding protein|nr:ABC transporter ATP-binding protein [Planctomycetota bacterium]
MPAAVEVTDLVKRYGTVEAVRGVTLSVAAGEIVALLGPNGAGKTSTLECIIGLRQADGGAISVCGIDARRDPSAMRERIGVQLQATALPEQLRVREALRLFASFYRHSVTPQSLLDRFSLGDKADATFASLSGGQRQRLGLALAVINEPEVLFLDEPTAGMDPQARRELHAVIRAMKAAGRSVLITTHYIEEAEELCDRVAVVDHGKVIACDTPAALIARSASATRIVCTSDRPLDRTALAALESATAVEVDGVVARISSGAINRTVIALVHHLEAVGATLVDLQIRKPSLEDVFIELTGRRLRD